MIVGWALAFLTDLLCLPLVLLIILASLGKTAFDDPRGDKNPVLLLHGSGGTQTSLWYGLYRMSFAGHPVYSVALDRPFFGTRNATIQSYAKVVRRKVGEIKSRHPGKKIGLVGVSMGGLVAAMYDILYARNHEADISHIVGIGTPWQGSSMIQYLPSFLRSHRHKEMEPGSALLQWIEAQTQGDERYYSVASVSDYHVPFPGALKPDSTSKVMVGVSHWRLSWTSEVWTQIVEWMQ